MIDSNKDKQHERDHKDVTDKKKLFALKDPSGEFAVEIDELWKRYNIVEQLKEHYVGTAEHISDCSVCAYLKPIMDGKK